MSAAKVAAVLGIVGVAGQVIGLLLLARDVRDVRDRLRKDAAVRMDLPLAERLAVAANESVEQLWPLFINLVNKSNGWQWAIAGTMILFVAAVFQAISVF